MIHFVVLRYVLAAYVMSAPYVFIYLQQSKFIKSFDDELGNRLILRLHVVSTIAAVALFLATFEWGRDALQ